jgi:hypothetical protein
LAVNCAGEMCTRDYHPYKHGYGKLMFSGYHFIDLLMWLLSINDEVRDDPPLLSDADGFRVKCAKFCPSDALEQIDPERLRTLLQASPEDVAESLKQVPSDLSTLGELNVHAIVQSLTRSGAVECTASLNLLHNSFSRRAWFEPRPDLYKGNGRVRHERLVVQVGPLLSLQLHSYQAGKALPGSAANAETARAWSHTEELLAATGLSRPASPDAAEDGAYAAGHEEHFDVTIYRNTEVVGGPAVETIPFGKMMMTMEQLGEEGAAAAPTCTGHNEKARHVLLDQWLRRAEGGGLSPLSQQRDAMRMLSRLYAQLASAP